MQVQDPAQDGVEFHEGYIDTLMKPAKVSLVDIPFPKNPSAWHHLQTCRRYSVTLPTLIKLSNCTSPSVDPWRMPLIADLRLDIDPFILALWTWIEYHQIHISPIRMRMRNKDDMWDHAKGLLEAKVDDIVCSSSIHQQSLHCKKPPDYSGTLLISSNLI